MIGAESSQVTPVLELSGVGRTFGSGASETAALRSVHLTVKAGEFVAIVGPSGAGKSTLLNILGLLDVATSGTHRLNGVDVRTLRDKDRNFLRSEEIGFVFQDSHVLLDDTAASNAALGLKIQGAPMRTRRQRVGAVLADVGLSQKARERAINLSGGERQRVAIARAMATKPALLLADEPTGSLDSVNSQRIIDHLRHLNSAGVTVVVITHDQSVADAAGRSLRLVDGVLDDGTSAAREAEQVSRAIERTTASEPTSGDAPESSGVEAQRSPAFRNEGRPASQKGEPPVRYGGTGRARRLLDEVLDAVSSHSARPGRTLLLLAAFLLGTGGLVCSLGISQSAANQVADRLTAASLDEVVVRTTDTNRSDAGFYDRSSTASPITALEELRGVEVVGSTATVTSGDARITLLPTDRVPAQPIFDGTIRVTDAEYLEAQNARTSPENSGELLNNNWGGRVALLGTAAAESLGIASPGPGASIWIRGASIDVVGIISDTGRDPLLDNTIILSRAAADSLKLEDPSLLIRTEDGYPAPLSRAIPLAVDPAQPATVRVETVADLRSLQTGVATDLGTLIAVISWVLLALASLSAASAMYLSVLTRSSEIALRRAIGASKFSIWRIFTLEGLIIGAAGGVGGGAVGLFGVVIVCALQQWTPTLDLKVVGVGFVAGCVTGVLSAAYPALVAARANPATAIRG
jgi:macrolide transport system ATP-binding/permease protein